jgi:hypothetical protein
MAFHWRGILFFIVLALCPLEASAENHYRDQTPDSARGKPVSPMMANLALLQAAEKGWTDEIEKLLAVAVGRQQRATQGRQDAAGG